MKKRFIVFILLFITSPFFAFQWVFDVPEEPSLLIRNQQKWQEITHCYENQTEQVLDFDGKIQLLVWNIYKQKRTGWELALNGFAKNSQLMLLQEASLTGDFTQWITSSGFDARMVRAFNAFDITAGVMSLSASKPDIACAYTEIEPWLRLPKSGLYTQYRLSNGQSLAVINIHSVNFALGTKEYRQQLDRLYNQAKQHDGPVLMAGDFNSWSDTRMKELKDITARLGLEEVVFTPDNRKQFITGLPLDHIFYRGLSLVKAKASFTDASDHSPLIASFKLEQ